MNKGSERSALMLPEYEMGFGHISLKVAREKWD